MLVFIINLYKGKLFKLTVTGLTANWFCGNRKVKELLNNFILRKGLMNCCWSLTSIAIIIVMKSTCSVQSLPNTNEIIQVLNATREPT